MRRALAGLLVVLAAPAVAQAQECAGEKVTITGRGEITGTPGPDVILGGPGGDTIRAGAGDDVVCGGGGSDTLDGGPGRDELLGQDGGDGFIARRGEPTLAEDVITGGVGGGPDAVSYEFSPVGVRVDMSTGLVAADGVARRGGLLGIETVIGSPHDDAITGTAKPETIRGLGGDDVITARGVFDRLLGGAGTDTVSFAASGFALRLDADSGDAVMDGKDTEVRDFEAYVGTRFDDRMTGDGGSERLEGGPGDDRLKGRGDNDNLLGGPGDDTLFPGPGDDVIDGGANEPVRGVGAPGDLVSYHGEKAQERPGVASSFDFEAYLTVGQYFQDPPHTSGVGEDFLVGIESIRAPKDAMSYLEGDAGPNVLIGGFRIDSIEGLGGNDLIFGLGSNDNLHGGDGDDFIDAGGGGSNLVSGGAGDDTCLNTTEQKDDGCETKAR